MGVHVRKYELEIESGLFVLWRAARRSGASRKHSVSGLRFLWRKRRAGKRRYSQSGRVNESRRQKIRVGDLQRRRSRFHALGRAEQSECSRRRQKSTRGSVGALEGTARAIVKLAGTARCAVRTPQRGVPTSGTLRLFL